MACGGPYTRWPKHEPEVCAHPRDLGLPIIDRTSHPPRGRAHLRDVRLPSPRSPSHSRHMHLPVLDRTSPHPACALLRATGILPHAACALVHCLGLSRRATGIHLRPVCTVLRPACTLVRCSPLSPTTRESSPTPRAPSSAACHSPSTPPVSSFDPRALSLWILCRSACPLTPLSTVPMPPRPLPGFLGGMSAFPYHIGCA